jgi:hypothetical protein
VIDLMAATETQPCAGTFRAGAKNGKKEANQKGTRSTTAGIALAPNRRSQRKTTVLGRPGSRQHEETNRQH